MSEPLNTEALLQTVREALRVPPEGHHNACDSRKGGECDCFMRTYTPALDALDTLASELERLQNKLNTDSQNFELETRKAQIASLEAELGRVRAERDYLMERAGARVHENVHADVQARLDRAVEALREIAVQSVTMPDGSVNTTSAYVARAALEEIEESG